MKGEHLFLHCGGIPILMAPFKSTDGQGKNGFWSQVVGGGGMAAAGSVTVFIIPPPPPKKKRRRKRIEATGERKEVPYEVCGRQQWQAIFDRKK